MLFKQFFTTIFLLALASLVIGRPSKRDLDLTQFSRVQAIVQDATANKDPSNALGQIAKLSPECVLGIVGLIADPELFKCIPLQAVIQLVLDPTLIPSLIANPGQNIDKIEPILDGFCEVPKCSAQFTNKVVNTLKTACSKDAADPLIQMATAVFGFYSPIRDIACFKDNKNDFCVIDAVHTFFSLPTPPKAFHLLGSPIDNIAFSDSNLICTPCDKAIVNTLFNFLDSNQEAKQLLEQVLKLPDQLLSLAKLGVGVKCGASFLDGKVGDPSKAPPCPPLK